MGSKHHPYNVIHLPDYDQKYEGSAEISSIAHLRWGLCRFYTDALLYFGNIRQAYRELRNKTFEELLAHFSAFRFDTGRLTARGPHLPMAAIAKDDRYLVAELACKTYDPDSSEPLENILRDEFRRRKASGAQRVTFRELITPPKETPDTRQREFEFSITEVLDVAVANEDEIAAKIRPIASRFTLAREKALQNTNGYISMIDDLDVYVATSMRNREDFRKMADFCEMIFGNVKLKEFSFGTLIRR